MGAATAEWQLSAPSSVAVSPMNQPYLRGLPLGRVAPTQGHFTVSVWDFGQFPASLTPVSSVPYDRDRV